MLPMIGVCTFRRLSSHSRRLQSTLVSKHDEFLRLVESQGTGSISLIHDGPIAEMTISNVSKRNAISGKMMKDLAVSIDSIESEGNGVRAIVVRGEGDMFCSGADFSLVKGVLNSPEKGALMCDFMTDALNRIRNSGAISACLIDGPALGGGAEFTTACDFRIMKSLAYVTFVQARMGVTTGWGGTRRLVEIVGRSNALKLLCKSEILHPSQALAIGFADAVIESDEYQHSTAIVKRYLAPYLAQPYPRAVAAAKTVVSMSSAMSREEAIAYESQTFQQRWWSEDNQAALEKK